MASLTGTSIQSTYDSLLKISGNDPLTASLQRITDGLGNFTPLYLSTTAVEISSGLNVIGSITGSNLSGTNTGDETNSSIKSKLGAATSSNDGYLTSTDWSTFNAKQPALGYTPVPQTRTLTINGTTFDLSADRSWSIAAGVTSFNTRTGAITLTSGDVTGALGFTPYNATNPSNYISLTALSASSPLSYNNTTGAFSIQQASSFQNGFLSSTDWSTFNSKQNALGYTPVPETRTLTINGTTLDLSANRSFTVGTITGSGTAGRIPVFATSTSLGDSQIFTAFDETAGAMIGIGATPNASPIPSRLYVSGASYMAGSITATGAISSNQSITAVSFVRSGGTSSQFLKADGSVDSTSYQPILTNPVTGTGTTNTLPKFTGASAIGNSNITDTGSLITLGSNSFVNGGFGIGSGVSAGTNLVVLRNNTGATTANSVYVASSTQSDVTTTSRAFTSEIGTAAASFTLTNLTHFQASQGIIGAGSSITNQFGFSVGGGLISATNNYGFYGNMPSGTGRWNLYMNGTANNYLAGGLGIGATFLTAHNLRVDRNITGGSVAHGIYNGGIVQSDVTTQARYYTSAASTQATTFTCSDLRHYLATQGTFGAGSTVAVQHGFIVDNTLIGATTNYGFRGQIASGTGRWNLYMDGTAGNYLAGDLAIGTTTLTAIGGHSGILTLFGSNATALSLQDSVGRKDIRLNDGNLNITNSAGTSHLYVANAGNVGIGTSSPGGKLHIRQSSSEIPLIIDSSSVSNPSYTQYRVNGSSGWEHGMAGSGDSYKYFFSYGSFGSGTSLMTIQNNGNVGIGTSSPGSLLHVGGASGAVSTPTAIEMDGTYRTGAASFNALKFYLFKGASESYGIGLGDLADVQYWAGSSSTGAHRFFTSQTERMRITSGGNVGIGTTNPGYRLDVNGTIYASGDVLAFSDISVKENIRPIDNALNRVLNSRGVVYDRIDNGDKDNIGFIAQELEVNFPELVSTKADGTKSVKYQNAVAILFEAIKEQQAQIDELKKLLN